MFRPAGLLAAQVVPTAPLLSTKGGRGFYIRAEHDSLPHRASDMLAVRIGQLTAGDFHPMRLAALLAAPLRFAVRVTPFRRKTRLRLVASLYRAGLSPAGLASKSFRDGYVIPSSLPRLRLAQFSSLLVLLCHKVSWRAADFRTTGKADVAIRP